MGRGGGPILGPPSVGSSIHHPSGAPLNRRAIQLGLRGEALAAFGRSELLEVIDMSEFVAEQRTRMTSGGIAAIVTPRERVYRPADQEYRFSLTAHRRIDRGFAENGERRAADVSWQKTEHLS